MKPLTSPVTEFSTMGIAQVLAGFGFLVVGIVADAPASELVALPLTGAIFGGLMYVLAYRRFTRQVLAHTRAAPIAEREPSGRTHLRTGAVTGALIPFVALVGVVMESFPAVGGILAGNGAALLLVVRLMRRRERAHSLRLLREPRYRWRWRMRSASGFLDPEDFYSEPGAM